MDSTITFYCSVIEHVYKHVYIMIVAGNGSCIIVTQKYAWSCIGFTVTLANIDLRIYIYYCSMHVCPGHSSSGESLHENEDSIGQHYLVVHPYKFLISGT